MENRKLLAIGDEIEITDNESKEVKKKLQYLIKKLYQECSNINECGDKATLIVMSEPQFRGVLTSIVSQAVAEAVVRVMILNNIK
ncbi:MAG: hypothetical protein WCS03_08090 [Bacteroidota bacterium]